MYKIQTYRNKLTGKQTKKGLLTVIFPFLYQLHSFDDKPALAFYDGNKYEKWFFKGKIQRLTGPAIIVNDDYHYFHLNGEWYSFNSWIHKHPNIDIYLEANGYKTEEQKAMWKLKNL